MNSVRYIHIAAGLIALLMGALAVLVRKGGKVHVSTGTWFCVAMFVLGITAAILEPLRTPPGSPVGGVMVCYFVATAWMAAHRRSGIPGRFEQLACACVLLIGAAIIADGFRHAFAAPGQFKGPPGPAALFALGGLCLLTGVADVRYILRGTLSTTQRITRHLWRMCFALFIATGSFFLGQQKVMPLEVRGSPILLVLALAPFGVMLYWLVRMRWSKPRASTRPSTAIAEG